jgi:hypothetical protein
MLGAGSICTGGGDRKRVGLFTVGLFTVGLSQRGCVLTGAERAPWRASRTGCAVTDAERAPWRASRSGCAVTEGRIALDGGTTAEEGTATPSPFPRAIVVPGNCIACHCSDGEGFEGDCNGTTGCEIKYA